MTESNARRQTHRGEYGRDPTLRAGDRDRDAVAENLRTQHAEGRLDTDELQQRIDRCYEAKTLGELDQLLTDLPRESIADESSGWRRTTTRLLTLAPVLVTLAAVCALTGRHVIWLAVPLIFLTSRLVRSRYRPWWSSRLSQPRDRWG
jgi:hypothetical protein